MDVFEAKRKSPNREEVLSFFWEVVKIVVISLVIIIPVRYYLFQPFFVKGASMEPTFNDGDYVLIDEISYSFRDPQRGEVMIFRSPQDHSQFFIKRVVGLPGEQIQIKDNRVFIYNKQNPEGITLDETEYLDPNTQTLGNLRINIDNNEYFVLGDNREFSSDSRSWGPLHTKYIIGKMLWRVFSLNTIGELVNTQ